MRNRADRAPRACGANAMPSVRMPPGGRFVPPESLAMRKSPGCVPATLTRTISSGPLPVFVTLTNRAAEGGSSIPRVANSSVAGPAVTTLSTNAPDSAVAKRMAPGMSGSAAANSSVARLLPCEVGANSTSICLVCQEGRLVCPLSSTMRKSPALGPTKARLVSTRTFVPVFMTLTLMTPDVGLPTHWMPNAASRVNETGTSTSDSRNATRSETLAWSFTAGIGAASEPEGEETKSASS